jgi:hypothetical protein
MALHVRIIGKGCYFCQQLTKIATEVVAQMHVPDATVEQVDELDELLDFGVVNPPALVVNGKLKMMGRVLVRSHVHQAIAEEAAAAQGAAGREEESAPGG